MSSRRLTDTDVHLGGVEATARAVLTSREHIIGLQPLKNGLMGTLLRYPYEVRSEDEYFDDIQDVKVTKDNWKVPARTSATKTNVC